MSVSQSVISFFCRHTLCVCIIDIANPEPVFTPSSLLNSHWVLRHHSHRCTTISRCLDTEIRLRLCFSSSDSSECRHVGAILHTCGPLNAISDTYDPLATHISQLYVSAHIECIEGAFRIAFPRTPSLASSRRCIPDSRSPEDPWRPPIRPQLPRNSRTSWPAQYWRVLTKCRRHIALARCLECCRSHRLNM